MTDKHYLESPALSFSQLREKIIKAITSVAVTFSRQLHSSSKGNQNNDQLMQSDFQIKTSPFEIDSDHTWSGDPICKQVQLQKLEQKDQVASWHKVKHQGEVCPVVTVRQRPRLKLLWSP